MIALNDLFDSTTFYYSKFRLSPPMKVIEELHRIADLNGTETLLDIGCGPGTSTFIFSPFFKNIIALDSNNLMIQEGIRQASKQGITNINWICSDVETVNLEEIGKVDVVIFVNSFHWMNQELILQKLKDVIKKGGAIMGGGSSWNKQQDHDKIIISTIREFIGEKRKTNHGEYREPITTFKEVIDNSPFTFIERKILRFKHEFIVEELIGLQLSTSYANEKLLGTRRDEFVEVLNKRLNNLSQNGKIVSEEEFEVILFSKQ